MHNELNIRKKFNCFFSFPLFFIIIPPLAIPYFLTIIFFIIAALVISVSFILGRRYFFKRLNEEIDKRLENYIKVKEEIGRAHV